MLKNLRRASFLVSTRRRTLNPKTLFWNRPYMLLKRSLLVCTVFMSRVAEALTHFSRFSFDEATASSLASLQSLRQMIWHVKWHGLTSLGQPVEKDWLLIYSIHFNSIHWVGSGQVTCRSRRSLSSSPGWVARTLSFTSPPDPATGPTKGAEVSLLLTGQFQAQKKAWTIKKQLKSYLTKLCVPRQIPIVPMAEFITEVQP